MVVARTLTRSRLDAERAREAAAHLLAVRRDPRLLADQDAVRVDELEAGLAHLRVGVAQQVERVGAVPARVAGGEERADVAEPGRAEHGVGERVRDHVAVGVAGEAARMLDRDAAEHERNAVLERMRVDADADAELRHRAPPGARRASETRSAAGGGSCRWPQGPRRMWTATIPAASAGSTSLSTRSPT